MLAYSNIKLLMHIILLLVNCYDNSYRRFVTIREHELGNSTQRIIRKFQIQMVNLM